MSPSSMAISDMSKPAITRRFQAYEDEDMNAELQVIRMTEQEEDILWRMHRLVGERWDLIAGRIPSRTPVEIETYCEMSRSLKRSISFAFPEAISTERKVTYMTEQEEDIFVRMHKLVGNRWDLIAGRIPGWTAIEIEMYYHWRENANYGRLSTGSIDEFL